MNTNKRNTVQRSLVLEAVRSLGCHPTPAEVYEEVCKAHPSISRATVYRNLAVLSESGAIMRVKVPGGIDRYDCRGDAHSHGVCRCCGAVCDIDAPIDEGALQPTDSHGFEVEGCSVVFFGLCADCAAQQRERPALGA